MMRVLAASLRRPAPLLGSLVALTLAALIVVISASLVGTGSHATGQVGRLAGAAVVVTGGQQVTVRADGSSQSVPLPDYRRVPDELATRIAAEPDVAMAVPDVSFPLALETSAGHVLTGSAAAPLTGHDWASARVTPFRLTAGTPPRAPGQIVIGTVLARQAGLHAGSLVWLAGQDRHPLRVTGIVTDGRADADAASSVFFAPAQASALYGHPGQADLIAVVARPGVTVRAVAAQVRSVTGGSGRYEVSTGAARASAENPAVAGDDANIEGLGGSAGIDIILISLFVVAGTVALSVSQRQRQFALLRAVGATPGQVRRAVLAELSVLAVLAGLIAWLPGSLLAALTVAGLDSHGLLPAGSAAWTSPWLALIAIACGLVVAVLSGVLAARRAGRAAPADALRESARGRRWPHPVRTVLGLAGLGGSTALVVAITRSGAGTQQLGTALSLLLALMVTLALLGPLLAALAELLLRWPARALSVTGRLAMADVRAQPRRIASAMLPVALSLSFAGTVYFLDSTLAHVAVVQQRQRLTAADTLTAPGPGLSAAVVRAAAAQPGVRDAVGLTPAEITVTDPDLDTIAGEVVSGGTLPGVLNLGATTGSLRHLGPGEIAVSKVEASGGSMNVHLGDSITVYLPDGAPYRARVSAIFTRSFGFADVLIPAGAAAGHLPSPTVGQVLVQTARPGVATELQRLAPRFPGLQVASRALVNTQDQELQSQNAYANDLILVAIAAMAAVTVVNTLVMAAVERRQALRLLRRVGATMGQLTGMTLWQTALLTVTGIVAGVAAAGVTLSTMTRAITGSWPYVPLPAAVTVIVAVLALTLTGTLGPTAVLARGTTDG
jgi:putative ABC transport system permease protein